ncbi:MAG: hypothetical protein SXV54_20705 [Chloroflexota bacterium]|nr:hypothetical protein [Chloroflexota bacterium]
MQRLSKRGHLAVTIVSLAVLTGLILNPVARSSPSPLPVPGHPSARESTEATEEAITPDAEVKRSKTAALELHTRNQNADSWDPLVSRAHLIIHNLEPTRPQRSVSLVV